MGPVNKPSWGRVKTKKQKPQKATESDPQNADDLEIPDTENKVHFLIHLKKWKRCWMYDEGTRCYQKWPDR